MNELEKALMAAASDPAARPNFYRTLIASDLLVINESSEPNQLSIRPIEINGADALPVFSSVERLQAAITSQVNYLQLNARELMKITRGARLMLNPGADYGKELVPEEIAQIIDGTILQPRQSYVAPEDTKILIGQPSRYPQELVDVLTRVFANNPSVRAAYLAHFFNPAVDEKPHTLVAIDADDYDRVVGEAGLAAQGVTVPDPPVDFIRFGEGGLDDYFRGAGPFYKR